jgi:hypothetical protein
MTLSQGHRRRPALNVAVNVLPKLMEVLVSDLPTKLRVA